MTKSILLVSLLLLQLYAKGNDPIVNIFKQINNNNFLPLPNYAIYDPFAIETSHKVIIYSAPKKRRWMLPKLQAIIGNRAFIDGRWISKGARIRGFRLIEIKKNGVVLQRQGVRYYLEFHPNIQLFQVTPKVKDKKRK